EAGSDRHLRREMEHLFRRSNRRAQCLAIADIGNLHLEPIAMRLSQPLDVQFAAGTRQIIEEQNVAAGRQEAIGEVGADEAGASGNQDVAATVPASALPQVRTSGIANCLQPAFRPCAIEQLWTAVRALESVVILPLIGMAGFAARRRWFAIARG